MALYPQYPIRTMRLSLRPFTRGDVDAVFSYRRREDVARFLFDQPLSRDECALAVQQRAGQLALEADGDKIILAVELAQTAVVIGEVSLIWRIAEAQQGELGWIFDPGYHRQGYATEAANAMVQLAFSTREIVSVCARCDIGNAASWRLMERLGMTRQAHVQEHSTGRGGKNEEYVYALRRDEWDMMQMEKSHK